jgi:hypothetical protein
VELAARSLERLVLEPDAVAGVLADLQRGLITTSGAQVWASFVRRGYFSGGLEPVRPIHIDYDEGKEDAMVEAIARLDELGDDIDGEISNDELNELLATLQPG